MSRSSSITAGTPPAYQKYSTGYRPVVFTLASTGTWRWMRSKSSTVISTGTRVSIRLRSGESGSADLQIRRGLATTVGGRARSTLGDVFGQSSRLNGCPMSDLIAVAYDERATAERVRDELAALTREHVIEIEDAVVEPREDGRVKLHQTTNPAGAGAAVGALWGGLIGLVFLAPLLGMAIGAAVGGATGALTDLGVDDRFVKDLGENLPENGAPA
jgi:uncharacterized membrane protein